MNWVSIVLSVLLVLGCDNDLINKKTDEVGFGTIKSSDMDYLPVDDKFNLVLRSGRVDIIEEIDLKVQEETDNLNDPAQWALIVRSVPNPLGVLTVSEVDVRLFSNYTEECCLNNSDPLGKYEVADQSYKAVSGYIHYVSDIEATFSLEFQKESSIRSDELYGQIVSVSGCWNLGDIGKLPGCRL